MNFHRLLVPVAALAVFLALGSSTVTAADRPAADEAARVHVLLVCDTIDASIGDSVRADLETMRTLFEDAFAKHKDRLDLTMLSGKDVNREAVLNHYHELKTGPSDTLFFYFSGHGGNEKNRHYFSVYPSSKEDETRPLLLRDEVRVAMQAQQPRLVILLSDACNYPTDYESEKRPAAVPPEWETIRSLFLLPHGLVDINSVSEGEVAVGLEQGGFFTLTLAEVLRKPFKELDTNKDGFLHWQQLLPALQDGAQAQYSVYRKKALPELDDSLKKAVTVNEKTAIVEEKKIIEHQHFQTVRVYNLPPLARFGARVMDNEGQGVKVVLVEQYTPAALAGFKTGDVILKIGDRAVNSPDDFAAAVAAAEGTVRVEYKRRGADTPTSTADVHIAPWKLVGKDG